MLIHLVLLLNNQKLSIKKSGEIIYVLAFFKPRHKIYVLRDKLKFNFLLSATMNLFLCIDHSE